VTVRHDLNELKLCMYEAISHSLDRCPLPPEKISVALAVAIDTTLDDDAVRIERFNRELLRCMEQRTEGVTATMKIMPDVDIDVDAAETRMQDEQVEDLYIELNEDAIPDGILDYEDGDEKRNPMPDAYEIALAFAVAMCLKHDVARVERFIQDLHAERRRVDTYQAKYAPAWSRLPFGRGNA
jgi:hypothetical protein